jgi:hypothetical protein
MIALSFLGTWVLLASTAFASTYQTHINYTVVPGIFLQDEPSTDASTFNFTASNFGLINRTYPSDYTYFDHARKTQWQRLSNYISSLNHQAHRNERYSLLFLGRHGEGYHNAAETYYGTPAWNCFYSERDGNGSVTWADAQITQKGRYR